MVDMPGNALAGQQSSMTGIKELLIAETDNGLAAEMPQSGGQDEGRDGEAAEEDPGQRAEQELEDMRANDPACLLCDDGGMAIFSIPQEERCSMQPCQSMVSQDHSQHPNLQETSCMQIQFHFRRSI